MCKQGCGGIVSHSVCMFCGCVCFFRVPKGRGPSRAQPRIMWPLTSSTVECFKCVCVCVWVVRSLLLLCVCLCVCQRTPHLICLICLICQQLHIDHMYAHKAITKYPLVAKTDLRENMLFLWYAGKFDEFSYEKNMLQHTVLPKVTTRHTHVC